MYSAACAIAVASVIEFVNGRRETALERTRQIGYDKILREYSSLLKPGMSRAEVERYLKGRNLAYVQRCCIRAPRQVWADLVKIGTEKAPWFCNNSNVYVAMEFSNTEPHDAPVGGWDTDRLESVTLYPQLEQCL